MKGSAGKAPTIQWYYSDWLKDTQLQRADAATRGIWMNILMFMAEDAATGKPDGVLEGLDIDQICRLGNCTRDQAERFICEALTLRFCDIKIASNGNELNELTENDAKTASLMQSDVHQFVTGPVSVTIMSRRMFRDGEKRREWRERKRLQREREASEQGQNDAVPDMSNQNHSTSSTSTSTSTSTPNGVLKTHTVKKPATLERLVKELESDFSEWWAHYPRKVSRQAAAKAYAKAWRDGGLPLLGDLIEVTKAHAAHWVSEGRPMDKVPHGSTWLNNSRWQDELQPSGCIEGECPFSRDEIHIHSVWSENGEDTARREAAKRKLRWNKIAERRDEWNEYASEQ